MGFTYYNANPDKLIRNDCVCRAISKALHKDYNDIAIMLYKNAKENNCECLNINCYEKMLDRLGIEHYKVLDESTIDEISQDFKDRVVIIRIKGHLTVSMYGEIIDIWDCRNEIATDFWVI